LTLGDKQRLMVGLLARLYAYAYDEGYELTLGEAYRTDEQAEINALGPAGREHLAEIAQRTFPALAAKLRNNGPTVGARHSNHSIRLAQDLNLFRNGVYLSATEDHRKLGEFWESLHPLCCWGGRFGDGGHYSIEHEGRK
jgi:hypothetical protein